MAWTRERCPFKRILFIFICYSLVTLVDARWYGILYLLFFFYFFFFIHIDAIVAWFVNISWLFEVFHNKNIWKIPPSNG